MKRIMLAFALLFAMQAKAQTRLLVGVEAADNFGNYTFGPMASVEVPLGKHLEWDGKAAYSPLASHIAIGSGYSYGISASGIGWLTNTWGLYGGINDGAYKAVSKTSVVHKSQPHVFGGFVYRGLLDGLPSRLFFGYTREIQNGISSNGTESSHLNAFNVDYKVRFGCKGAACFRVDIDNYAGWVLNQSNPVCDGTYGVTGGPNGGPCPRRKTLSGGVSGSFTVEFPRPRGHEYDPF